MIRGDLFENNYLFSRFSVNQTHKKYTHALYNVVDMYNENISLYTKFKSLFEKHMVKYFPDDELYDNFDDKDSRYNNSELYGFRLNSEGNYVNDDEIEFDEMEKLYNAGLKDYMYLSSDAILFLNIPNETCTYKGYCKLLKRILHGKCNKMLGYTMLFTELDYISEYEKLIVYNEMENICIPSDKLLLDAYIQKYNDYPKLAFIHKNSTRIYTCKAINSKIDEINRNYEKLSRSFKYTILRSYTFHDTCNDNERIIGDYRIENGLYPLIEIMFLDKTNVVDMLRKECDSDEYYKSIFDESIKQKNEYLLPCPKKCINITKLSKVIHDNKPLRKYYYNSLTDYLDKLHYAFRHRKTCKSDSSDTETSEYITDQESGEDEIIYLNEFLKNYGEYKIFKSFMMNKNIIKGVNYNHAYTRIHVLYSYNDILAVNIMSLHYITYQVDGICLEYFYLLMEALGYNSCECAKRNSVFINHDMDNNLDTIRPEIYASDYSIYYNSKLTNTKSDYVKVYGIDKFVALYAVSEMKDNLYDHLMNAICDDAE